jgi:hypothetical protein
MMKRLMFYVLVMAALVLGAMAGPAYPQRDRTTFQGTAVIYGSGMNTRTVTRDFTLILNGRTSNADTARLLNTLEEGGQDALLRSIRKEDLGRFSMGASVGVPVNAVIVDNVEGRQRVRVLFERWQGFGELRGGYRSLDYPFGYLEIIVDPRTGRGEGTIISQARVRFRNARNNRPEQVEIEDFGTFPGRLMGVRMRGSRLT